MHDSSVLDRRRAAVARAWGEVRGPVVVPAGLPLPIAGTDQLHDFHAHPEHVYLAGAPLPGAVLVFDAREGWRLFVPRPTAEERVWTGDGSQVDAVAAQTKLPVAERAEFGPWLESHRGEAVALLGNQDLLTDPAGYGLAGWQALEPIVDAEASARLSSCVSEARRSKDADELAAMRAAAAASRMGHLAGLWHARPGMTERQLQVEIEAAMFRAGGDRTAYGSIVGAGPNAAVLHFPPSSRSLGVDELVLVDAGAEVDSYASDVTRTYPTGRRFEGLQRDLYQLVLAVQEAAIGGARPGREYRGLHLEAAAAISIGLVDLGILRGDPAGLVERDAHALFFPHGLGHMLGLATHDAGGCLAGRPASDRLGLRYLRADLPLAPGYVVTVEPGVYFIRALLEDPALRRRFRDDVAWERVDRLLDFGGIRVEDDVLVREDGPEVLSAAIPKSLADVEALRQEALSA
ncbi:MAG: aminopeptidase P family protein [Dehalococcoidia bacterium]|nr:aminopeptidase P family protein [Dehalococcoidia bacterium]